jgi:hypothetical protein
MPGGVYEATENLFEPKKRAANSKPLLITADSPCDGRF